MDPCFDANTAVAYVEGDLDGDLRESAEGHLADCTSCRRLVVALAQEDDDIESVGGADIDHIGRYVIQGILGRGSMGEVFEAYDPKLERRVALKLVRPFEGADEVTGRTRLLREAQALAKLSHPNVVPVFDVGDFKEQIYIAMELVDGVTLEEWLSEARSSADILSMFVQAGQGLAAAHQRDMVHRDFKPANVLVGHDGRPRVVDFGLVRPAGLSGDGPNSRAPQTDVLRTQTGVAVGTPAFMAPEQFLGSKVDARADQFSFAVALYEALYSQRPFAGAEISDLARAVCSGDVASPPAKDGVSRAVRDALLHALRPLPKERFATMSLFLAQLETEPPAWRQRPAMLVVAGVAMAIAVVVGLRLGQTSAGQVQPCAKAGAEADRIWNPGLERQVAKSAAASGHPDPEVATLNIARRLAVYQAQWEEIHKRTCKATHVDKSQGAERYEQQLSCLYDGLLRAEAITRRAARPLVASDLDDLVAGATRLPVLEHCESPTSTEARRPMPKAGQKTAVRELRGEISLAFGDLDMGNTATAAVGEALLERARTVGFAPLTAEALHLAGKIYNTQGDNRVAESRLREGVKLAAASDYDGLLALLWIEVIQSLYEQAKYADAIALAPVAEAAIVRSGSDPRVRAHGLRVVGMAYWWKPELDTAKELLTEAVEIIESTFGASDPDLPLALAVLAELSVERSEFHQALILAERAVSLADAAFGANHTQSCWLRVVRGMALVGTERYEEAIVQFTDVETVFSALTGGHPLLTWLHQSLADAHHGLGHLEEALASYRRAFELAKKYFGPKDYRASIPLRHIARVEAELGNERRAREAIDEALAIREVAFGPEHVLVAEVLVDLARLDRHFGHVEAALLSALRAEGVFEKNEQNTDLFLVRASRAKLLYLVPGKQSAGRDLARITIADLDSVGENLAAAELRAWLTDK